VNVHKTILKILNNSVQKYYHVGWYKIIKSNRSVISRTSSAAIERHSQIPICDGEISGWTILQYLEVGRWFFYAPIHKLL